MAKGLKTGGRKKGTPNVLTNELRTTLKNIFDKELETLPNRLDKLDGKDRIELLIKLLPYILPKVKEIDHQEGEPIQWSL